MHITVVSPDKYTACASLLRQMHRLRATIFESRMGWDVSVVSGEEHDQYDALKPTYILAVSETRVVGCARLLPACGPTMVVNSFPQLLRHGALAAHSEMVESSRFCVDTTQKAGRALGRLHVATLTMFAGIIEWSIANGYTEIVTATDLRFERILRRAEWPLTRLGEPARIGNTIAVAGSLPADRASFERVCPAEYRLSLLDVSDVSVRGAA